MHQFQVKQVSDRCAGLPVKLCRGRPSIQQI